MTKLALIGDKNYLKRDSISGSALVAAPSLASGWGTFASSRPVVHGFGFIPRLRVYFENSATDGKVYPAGGRRLTGGYPGLPPNSIFCTWEVDETTLTIYLESGTAKTGSRTVYWVIYKDAP